MKRWLPPVLLLLLAVPLPVAANTTPALGHHPPAAFPRPLPLTRLLPSVITRFDRVQLLAERATGNGTGVEGESGRGEHLDWDGLAGLDRADSEGDALDRRAERLEGIGSRRHLLVFRVTLFRSRCGGLEQR
jgi:hypothetical protein